MAKHGIKGGSSGKMNSGGTRSDYYKPLESGASFRPAASGIKSSGGFDYMSMLDKVKNIKVKGL